MMTAMNSFGTNKEAPSQPLGNSSQAGDSAGLRPFGTAQGRPKPVEGRQDQSGRGAAVQSRRAGTGPAPQVEFLPQRIRHQRLRRSRLIRQGYLLAVCVAVMGILTYVRAGRIAQARGDLATLENSRSNLQKQTAMITPLEHQMSDLLIKKGIDEELGGRTDCTVVLAELCRITPPSIVMVSLDLQTVKLPAEASGYFPARRDSSPTAGRGYRDSRPTVVGQTPGAPGEDATGTVPRRAGARLTITGLAINDVDVANFIGQLSANTLFRNVNMGYTKTIVFRGRSVREFQAGCYLAQ